MTVSIVAFKNLHTIISEHAASVRHKSTKYHFRRTQPEMTTHSTKCTKYGGYGKPLIS